MKIIEQDNKKAEKERIKEETRKEELKIMNEALDEFRESRAYPYVIKFFDEYEKQIKREINDIQIKEMDKVFMLPLKEQRATIAQMSKRNTILLGVLSIIKRVKGKL